MIMMESSVGVVTAILSTEHLLQDSIPAVKVVSIYSSALHKKLAVLKFLFFKINSTQISPCNLMTMEITI